MVKYKKVINIVLKELKALEPYVLHVSRYDSVYIRFNNAEVGSLRIGDHNGRAKYFYRWNLREDVSALRSEKIKSFVQYYYPISEVKDMCRHIINYNNVVLRSKK